MNCLFTVLKFLPSSLSAASTWAASTGLPTANRCLLLRLNSPSLWKAVVARDTFPEHLELTSLPGCCNKIHRLDGLNRKLVLAVLTLEV